MSLQWLSAVSGLRLMSHNVCLAALFYVFGDFCLTFKGLIVISDMATAETKPLYETP